MPGQIIGLLEQAAVGAITALVTTIVSCAWSAGRHRLAAGTLPGGSPALIQQVEEGHVPGEQAPGQPAAPRARGWLEATFLGRLAEPTRAVMLRAGITIEFPAGGRLMNIGAAENHSYLLLRGCVKVSGNDGGREPLLGMRLPGDLVGEMAMLSSAPRSATVVACSAVVARRITGREMHALMRSFPEVAVGVAAMLSERLRWADMRRVDVSAVPPRCRVSRVLLAMDDVCGGGSEAAWYQTLPLTQAEVASLAGVRMATAEKALGALRRSGAIRLGYRQITVTDREALAAEVLGADS